MSNQKSSRRSTTRSSLRGTRHSRVSSLRASARPASAHQHRGDGLAHGRAFDAPEVWHDPLSSDEGNSRDLEIITHSAGHGYVHPVSADDVRERVLQLPDQFQQKLDVVQFSRMTRKRRLFPCYGLQWGTAVYLYPIEESLQELYVRAPRPAQRIETEMYGGRWVQDGNLWRLIWTETTIRDFYLNNVLIHEIGHINDDRNTSFQKREQFADWFAIEYGYRARHGRNGITQAVDDSCRIFERVNQETLRNRSTLRFVPHWPDISRTSQAATNHLQRLLHSGRFTRA